MCQLNQTLRELALEAKQHRFGTAKRRRILSLLFQKIQQSGQLPRCNYTYLPSKLREECTHVATQKLFSYLSEKIELYQPEREFMAWVIFLMQQRFFGDAERELRGKNFSEFRFQSLTELFQSIPARRLEEIEREETNRNFLEELVREIKEDMQGVFKSNYITNRPDANLQYILLQYWEGYSGSEIARGLAVPISTLDSFLKRKRPLLQQYFQDWKIQ
ncbi:hypothetical protein [Oscillatoria sp. FACHB-1406]|uniref:hypothetical protein n=1 Tax=Oscillatoria sp. FACHB-1406 TaxID=2692846 RepID=UPI0016843897|nr:hypothetical protein [Oscillatoria sp. FACHB-1406]MBD2578366.1 hypothetical protein [Oscillatoria sp. FACHB-1406]